MPSFMTLRFRSLSTTSRRGRIRSLYDEMMGGGGGSNEIG